MHTHLSSQDKPQARLRASLMLMAVAIATASTAWADDPDLTLLSLEKLMELKVVGASKYIQKQSEVAAAVSIITRDEIRAFGWRTIDQALSSLPGIHTTYDRQYQYLGARGFGLPGDYNTRVLVMINGNRVNDLVYDQGPTGRQFPLDMALVERIEFVAGPGGAVYGQNAMLGVVNVITRTGAELNGVELAAGYQPRQALGEGRVSWGKLLDNDIDVLVSGSGLRARGEDLFFNFGTGGQPGVARGLDAERDQQLFARAARGPWTIDLVYGNHRKADPTGAYRSDPLVPGQYQGDRYTFAQYQYQDSFRDDTLQVTARLFAGQERYTSILVYTGAPSRFLGESEWRGGEFRLLYTALANHKLMLGIEAQDNVRYDQSNLNLNTPANNILIPRSGYRTGVYLQDEWRLHNALTATLGLRADRNNVTGNKLSPRAGLIWQAGTATTLKALYGRAHRAPNAFERDYFDNTAQVANPALKGESINTREIVADHRVGRDLILRGSLYQWSIEKLIILGTDPVSGLSQYQSGSTVKANGLELSADKTWDWGGRLRGSLSFQSLVNANGTTVINSPNRLGKLFFSAPLPAGLRLGSEMQYDSKRRTVAGPYLGGYALFHLNLTATRLAPGLEVSLNIRNLGGKRFEQPAAVTNWQNALEQDGRTIRIDARYKF